MPQTRAVRTGLVPARRLRTAGRSSRRAAALAAALLAAACGSPSAPKAVKLCLGHFPNVTHAQALYGRATGSFEKAIGVPIEWTQFNAGPSAVEALFAGAVDASYLGPNPAINGFIKSQGRSFVIVAGAASGGAALVVRADAGISSEGGFHGKTVATPQLANTQDVAARLWFADQGYTTREKGGDLTILPLANPDQLLMFQKRQIDAAWTVEPWVSRLELEAGGKIFLEQTDAVTTVLVSSVKFLKTHPALAEKFRAAHIELTSWLNAHADEARALVRAGLSAEMRREMSAAIVTSAWRRLKFTDQVTQAQFDALVGDAQSVGFLRDAIPLDRLFSRKP